MGGRRMGCRMIESRRLGSLLRNTLQEIDDTFARLHNQPRICIVEHAGTTIIQEVGKSDPWIGEWDCRRPRCIIYKTLAFIQQEEEQARIEGRKPLMELKESLRGIQAGPHMSEELSTPMQLRMERQTIQ